MSAIFSRLFIAICILFGVHVLLYFSVVCFFSISSRRVRVALFLSAIILSVSFIAARILIGWDFNLFTRLFFVLSALWGGLIVNLLPALILCWLIALAGWIARRRPPMRYVCSALFALSFLFSAYGVWNAFNPQIKTVEVEIPGLPAVWEQKNIVLISDAHLGVIYTPAYFSRVASTINSLRPDVIFITGDLFDGISTVDMPSFIGPLNELNARDGIFYVNGNHENYIGIQNVLAVLARTKLKPLHDDVVQVDGVQIVGAEYPQAGFVRDVKKVIRSRKAYKKGMPAILLYHTTTNIDQKSMTLAQLQSRTYWRPDIDFTAAKELGVNLQLSGHTHSGQFIPFVYLARYLYKGYDYGLHRDGAFAIYTTSGLGSFGPPMRTGTGSEIVVLKLKAHLPFLKER